MANRRRALWLAVLRTPLGAAAAVLLVAVLLLAILAPILWSGQANTADTNHILQGASAQHLVGTDSIGRDIFYRVLVASRLSIELALLATVIGVVVGIVLGTAPTLLGRRVGRLITAVINIAVAFPALLLALFFAVIFGIGAKGAVLAIGIAGAPSFARLTQTLVASVASLDFVAAARVAGVGRLRLVVRHILPNIGEPLVVNATISAGGALLAFSGLSFLGLGVQAPSYDWGRLLNEGLNGIYIHPAAALAPGVAVVIAGLAFNLFGEAAAKGIGRRVPARLMQQAPQWPAAEPERPAAGTGRQRVLDVRHLRVAFPVHNGWVTPVHHVSFAMAPGEAVGVVGESGSGKSLTALAVAQLIEDPGVVSADLLELQGTSLLDGPARTHLHRLGTSLAMVFQDPMTSFNPTQRVGRQLAEVSEQHQGLTRRAAMRRAVERLRAVRVPAAERRARQYPHEYSGGMRQRAMIGMGLMGNPALIIADEPTTALDATVQRQVLRLLERIRERDNVAILLISHDITVVRQVCERVLVMYAGRIVEDLPSTALRNDVRHPYTRALMEAVPFMETDRAAPLTVIPGRPVEAGAIPAGCPFAPRCPLADDHCRKHEPALVAFGVQRRVACWHADGVAAGGPSDPALAESAIRAGDHQ